MITTEDFKSMLNTKGSVYLAGGWFSEEQAERLDAVKSIIENAGFNLFSPRDEALVDSSSSTDWRQIVFDGNVKAIKSASFMVAITNCKDMGTIHETGIAYASGIPIVYFAENLNGPFNLMLAQSGYIVTTSRAQLAEALDDPKLLKSIALRVKPKDYMYSDLVE